MTETVDQAQAQPPRALAGTIEDATSLSFVSTSHFEGSRGGRLASRPHVFDGAKAAPPLTVIFPGKTIGIYQKDGAERGVPWGGARHVLARFDLIQTPS
jgi:hypothetical protein